MSDETPRSMAAIVALPRETAPARTVYDDETRTRCFVLYATFGARNCAATARLYAAEVAALDLPVPDVSTIQRWAAEDRWQDQADGLWRNTRGRTPYELQILSMANTMLGQRALHDILSGVDERDVQERIVTLKAIEVAMRSREKLPELARVEPPAAGELETADMTREEREAEAKLALARPKGNTA